MPDSTHLQYTPITQQEVGRCSTEGEAFNCRTLSSTDPSLNSSLCCRPLPSGQ